MSLLTKPGRKAAIHLALILLALCGGAQVRAETAKVTLTVNNIQSDVGRLFVSVYDSKDTFLGEQKFLAQEVGLQGMQNGQVTLQLELPYGSYAISVHHDNNDNGEMDSNFIGIPKEPVGLSNGHVPKFGPPRFTKAMIEIARPEFSETIALND